MVPTFSIFLLLCLISSGIQLLESTRISVCPTGYIYAIASGRYCCETNDGSWKQSICSSSKVPCPNGSGCEDRPPSCPPDPRYRGFNNGYDGDYRFSFMYSDGKQVLINGDKCIWWKRQYRRWWIGPCKKVGTNSGYAYIKQDVRCASPSFGIEWIELDWRRGGSDKRLKGVQQRYRGCHETFDENGNETGSVCGSVTYPPLTSSGTAGVSVILRENTYIETCKWKIQQGTWKCI